MNIADYIRQKEAKKAQPKKEQTANQSPEEIINKYSNYSEDELVGELFREGSVSKGKVSATELDDFYSNAKNYLTPEQQNKMKSIIQQLKNN